MKRAARFALEPLGDQAALATFGDEGAALRFAEAVRRSTWPWLVDVVSAYVTVAIFFNLDQVQYDDVAVELRHVRPARQLPHGRLHSIPCCYERGPDLSTVAPLVGLENEEMVRLHSSVEYTVYAIGFCPGFPYLGYLPEKLVGVPRLDKPRLRVEPGSVGLTGRQTGIYPLPTPGGWHLIGQTPLQLVDVADGYFPIRTGDRVQFKRIDEAEFERLAGERLAIE